jgi:hypothetical protein
VTDQDSSSMVTTGYRSRHRCRGRWDVRQNCLTWSPLVNVPQFYGTWSDGLLGRQRKENSMCIEASDNLPFMPPPRIPREDDKPNFVAETSLPTVISAIAVSFTVLVSLGTGFVFFLACLDIWSIERSFGFSVTNYVEFIDYVQSVPTTAATVAAISAFAFGVYALIVVVFLRLTHQKRTKQGLQAISVFLVFVIAGYMVTVLYSTWKGGDALKK